MTSIKRRGRPIRRARASEAPTDLSSVRSNDDHENPLGSNKPRPSKTPSGSGSPKALLDSLRLHFPMILILIVLANGTWIKSFRHSFRSFQRMNLDLGTSKRPRPQMFTAVSPTWNVTTSANNVKTTLPSVESLD